MLAVGKVAVETTKVLNMIKIAEKIKNRKGESLAETLISLTIAAVAMTILAGALVSAANTSIKAKKNSTFMSSDNAATASSLDIILKASDGASVSLSSLSNTEIQGYEVKYQAGDEEKSYYYWIPEIEVDSSSFASTQE